MTEFNSIFDSLRAKMAQNFGLELTEEWEAEITKAGEESMEYIDAIVGMELLSLALVPPEAVDTVLGAFLHTAFFLGITRERYPEIYKDILEGAE